MAERHCTERMIAKIPMGKQQHAVTKTAKKRPSDGGSSSGAGCVMTTCGCLVTTPGTHIGWRSYMTDRECHIYSSNATYERLELSFWWVMVRVEGWGFGY